MNPDKPDWKKKFEKALEETCQEFLDMSDEEFFSELEKRKDGDIAKIVEEILKPDQIETELVSAKALLEETLDWLCSHPEAAELYKLHGPRQWCSDCQNYLRTPEDASLHERIENFLKKGEE
jgi:hypothetical protein